jgi:predicted aconitase
MELTTRDREMLDGVHGESARFAMSVILRMAEAVGAEDLISIEAAHIDACALMSRSSLDVIRHLVEHGGRVSVPTTLSMVSLDLENWRYLGIEPEHAETATRIADGYRALGCVPTWTCAPYQGYLTPRFGQQLAWGESNAVAYANSVLGARTNRYADYLDICAAITGRVPHAGLHRTENRRATTQVRVECGRASDWGSPAVWAALGACVGKAVGEGVPAIEGLSEVRPSNDALKALGAAAASFGSVGLFHLVGFTPEAPDLRAACQSKPLPGTIDVGPIALREAWDELSSAEPGTPIDAVVLGCPHASYAELGALAVAIARRPEARLHEAVQLLIFASAPMVELARRGGLLEPLARFGATIVRDSCPFHAPIVATEARTVMTDSAKCAYYAPGELDVRVAFGTLDDCVESAVAGTVRGGEAPWRGR